MGDLVEAFEEYWAASKYRSRNMIGYSDKKCLAFEAFTAGQHFDAGPQDCAQPSPEASS